jgi:hypothetical protein
MSVSILLGQGSQRRPAREGWHEKASGRRRLMAKAGRRRLPTKAGWRKPAREGERSKWVEGGG